MEWLPIESAPPGEYVVFRFAEGTSRDGASPNAAVGILLADGDIWLTCQWAGSRADADPIGWMPLPPST